MKLERTINAKESEGTVRDHVTSYFEKAGYKRVNSQPLLTYRRGSMFGSLLSFSPKGWQVQATIQTAPCPDQTTNVTIKLDIRTTGQLVTGKERSFWDSEMDGLEKAINSGYLDLVPSANQAHSSLFQNITAYLVIIGLTVVLTVIARLVFENRFVAYQGGLLGLFLGILFTWRWFSQPARVGDTRKDN